MVTECRDKNNATVNLTAGLNAAAYSAYFAFTTDRVVINVPEPSTPGDYNHNGIVDAADYTLCATRSAPPPTSAPTATTLRGARARSIRPTTISGSPTSATTLAAVPQPPFPEPATLWMFLNGVLAMWCRRRLKVS